MCLNIAILYKNLYIIIFDYNYIVYTGTVLLYNITVAAGAQEGLEELSHVEGQEGWR